MSSRLSGLYCDGASVCTGIAIPCSSIITWKNGHPNVSPYGTLEASDDRRDTETLGGVLHHRLRRDLRDGVALHARGAVAVAERGVFLQVVVLVLLVHATRAAVEERVDTLDLLHEVARRRRRWR